MHVSVDDAGNQYFVVTQLDGFDRVDRRPSVRVGTVRTRRDRCDTPVPYDDGTVCFDAMRQYGAVDGQIRTRTVVLEIVAEVVPVSLFKIAPVIMAVTIHACSIHAIRLLA